MKKIILLFVMVLLITGCNKVEETIDYNKANENLSTLKNGTELMFRDIGLVSKDVLEMKYGISLDSFTDYVVYMPTMTSSASMYAIFLPKEGSEEEALKVSDKIMQKYVESWTTIVYDAKEASLANDMLKTKYGKYTIYIISNDNDTVLETIKNSK